MNEKIELIDKILEKEWTYFSNLNNIGGRADCQDNREEFEIMRRAQWLTFNEETLRSYLEDLNSSENPLLEKYARMMEYNMPAEYEKIKNSLKEMSLEKRALVNKIMLVYIEWEEEFFFKYPLYASMGRPLYSFEDSAEDTSVETYLRGELYSYSEKTLNFYLEYVNEMYKNMKNLAIENMDNIARLQGFENSEDVEKYLKSKQKK